jgi:hypothetical protein
LPFDPTRTARVKDALALRGFSSSEPLLDAVFGNSPFLGRLAQREVGALGEYFAAGPHVVLNAAILLAQACEHADSEAAAMKELGRQYGDSRAHPLCRCLCRRRLALPAAQPGGA